MPEMNTPYYAWSGMVNGNKPADYVKAWKRVRTGASARRQRRQEGQAAVVALRAQHPRQRAQRDARLLPRRASRSTWSAPSAYNFGAAHGLTWTEPGAIFSTAYGDDRGARRQAVLDRRRPARRPRAATRAAGSGTLATLQRPPCRSSPASSGTTSRTRNGDFRIQGKTVHHRVQDLAERGLPMSSLDPAVAAKAEAKRKQQAQAQAAPRSPTRAPRKHRLHLPPADAPPRGATVDRHVDEPGHGRPPVLARRLRPHARPTAPRGPASRSSTAVDCAARHAVDARRQRRHQRDGKALDPTNEDTDLVLSRRRPDGRARRTPFVERLTFFWHRHFANSRASVSPPQLLLQQNDLFRKYSRPRRPTRRSRSATWRTRSRVNPSMLRYLTGEEQRQGRAERELRPRADGAVRARRHRRRTGSKNYSQDDVNGSSPRRSRAGRSTTPTRTPPRRLRLEPLVQRPEDRLRQVRQLRLDERRRPRARPAQPRAVPGHASCGTSSSPTPPDAGDAGGAEPTYVGSGLQLKPLLRYDPHRTRRCSSRSTSRT